MSTQTEMYCRCTLADRKVSGKSKDEQIAEKKQELEKRLQDVSGQLGTNKKQQQKKGQLLNLSLNLNVYFQLVLQL